jgi:hypothetical protein
MAGAPLNDAYKIELERKQAAETSCVYPLNQYRKAAFDQRATGNGGCEGTGI